MLGIIRARSLSIWIQAHKNNGWESRTLIEVHHNEEVKKTPDVSVYALGADLFKAYLDGLSGLKPVLTVSIESLVSGIGVAEDLIWASLVLLIEKGMIHTITKNKEDGRLTIHF